MIRLAERGELTLAADIIAEAFRETAETPHPSSALREGLAEVQAAWEVGGLLLGWTVAGGLPVGCVKFALDRRERTISYSRLAVLPDEQGRGLGGALVGWVEAHGWREGASRVACTARSIYPDNRPFYLRRGYVVVGYTGRYGVPDIRAHLSKPLG